MFNTRGVVFWPDLLFETNYRNHPKQTFYVLSNWNQQDYFCSYVHCFPKLSAYIFIFWHIFCLQCILVFVCGKASEMKHFSSIQTQRFILSTDDFYLVIFSLHTQQSFPSQAHFHLSLCFFFFTDMLYKILCYFIPKPFYCAHILFLLSFSL